jgi:hypothetical protein
MLLKHVQTIHICSILTILGHNTTKQYRFLVGAGIFHLRHWPNDPPIQPYSGYKILLIGSEVACSWNWSTHLQVTSMLRICNYYPQRPNWLWVRLTSWAVRRYQGYLVVGQWLNGKDKNSHQVPRLGTNGVNTFTVPHAYTACTATTLRVLYFNKSYSNKQENHCV